MARLVAMRSSINPGFLAAVPLIAIGIAAAQAQDNHGQRTLEVNGHTGQAIVYQISGKSYVDLESLARIANGSLSFRGGDIILHLPAADAASHEQPSTPGMTNDFMKASLQVLTSLNDWTHTLSHELQRGLASHPSEHAALRNKAADQLRVATIDAANESDEHALRLLTLHFNQVDNWNNKLAAERKKLDMGKYYSNPNVLAGDESYQMITSCENFLATMLPSGHFQESHVCN
jgi:hypothetical protein